MSVPYQLVIDAHDPIALGDFWASALGYLREAPPAGFDTWEDAFQAWDLPQDEWFSHNAVVDPDGTSPRIFFQRVPEPKAGKNRLHLDVRVTADVPKDRRESALRAEADRLEQLGAVVVCWVASRSGQGVGWAVMRDPEGNEFCLV